MPSYNILKEIKFIGTKWLRVDVVNLIYIYLLYVTLLIVKTTLRQEQGR